MSDESWEAIHRLEARIKTLEEQLETAGGLIATTAAMVITNSATLSILAITHQGDLGKPTALAHAKQREVLIDLLKQAGIDLPIIEQMDDLTSKAIENYQQYLDKLGSNP